MAGGGGLHKKGGLRGYGGVVVRRGAGWRGRARQNSLGVSGERYP